jgi:ankyrin repeat protein
VNGLNLTFATNKFIRSYLDCAIAHRKPAITRLLLETGADANNINGRGWTPLFHVFNQGLTQKGSIESSEEYIEMLAAQSFSEFHIQDKQGWSCVHRAAAFGTAMDIKILSRFQAPFMLQTVKLSWPPIFCAVQFENTATFTELTRFHPDFLTLIDVRMWTLLHVAVNIKSLQLISLLIDLGADPHARSIPTSFLVPEDLKNVAVTPGDIALLRGPDVLSTYLDALKSNGHKAELWVDDSCGEEELFWDVREEVE